MLTKNKLKQMLIEGKKPIGTYIKSTDPAITEVCCICGLDFIIYDTEHTSMSKETMSGLLRATELYNTTGLIRIRENSTSMILQALDVGAYGVQIPNIRTADEVKKVVSSMYYAPKGIRGFANTTRAGGYGLMPVNDYIRNVERELLCICYCETKEAYECLDDILAIDGLDMIFIGPSDLSQAFGVLGQTKHPFVQNAIDDIVARTHKAGKWAGTVATDGDSTVALFNRGLDMIVMSSDHGMLASTAKKMLSIVRSQK